MIDTTALAIALAVVALVGVLNIILVIVVLLRKPGGVRAQDLQLTLQHLEAALRREVGDTASRSRAEVTQLFSGFAGSLQAHTAESARTQNQQIDALAQAMGNQIAALQKSTADTLSTQLQSLQRATSDTLTLQLNSLSESNARRLQEVRTTLDAQLTLLQTATQAQLEQMRATVDEKLQTTLEKRLGESFKLVADRLEQVHKGLGEMQGLAQGVGDLRKVLTNVKSRGVFGEVQLHALLEQVFTQEQFAKNVETRPKSNQRVEFAIKFPGRSGEQPVWLPIDAKFPREDYERLVDAQERADAVGAEAAGKALEQRIKGEARTIAESYLAPPFTTDFAVMFLPTEGLYAEVLRRPGLVDNLQRDYRVTLAGPTTLLAMLNALQMGFRTLALEQQASQVWDVLGAVKTEFERFGAWVVEIKKSVGKASDTLDKADARTRQMYRALKSVEALPQERIAALLPDDGASGIELAEGESKL